MFFYKILYWIVWKFFNRRAEKRGIQNLPKNEGFIIAANHNASYDPLVIAWALKDFFQKELLPRGKKIYFLGSVQLRRPIYLFISFLINVFGEKIGYLPANRAGLKRSLELLEEGNVIVIFPEGQRNPSKIIYKGKKGVAVLALLSGVKVIPTGCFGPPTYGFWGKVKGIFSKRMVKFDFPLQIPKLNQEKINRHPYILKITLDCIMEKIAKAAGKEYLLMKNCYQTP